MASIYLDYAATTPVGEEVSAAMAPFTSERFGNPSSLHRWGRDAAAALEDARAVAAAALGARGSEIVFVRGGTESDNLAILGGLRALSGGGRTPRLLISAVEHHAVFVAAEHATRSGLAEAVTIPVSRRGELDWDVVSAGLSNGPCLVSAMWVNNETGVLLPIAELAARAKAAGAFVHTDASQAVGKVHVDVSEVAVDLLTATGHKIYGPRGMGVLFVRAGTPLEPMLYGGGQERGLRPGTEDVAGAVGLATAIDLAVNRQAEEALRMAALRERLEARLTNELIGVRVNGGDAERAPHVSSVGVSGIVDGQALLMALDLEGLAVSGGSACASGSQKGSHVIAAMYGPDDAYANIRFSFGRDTTEADIDRAVTSTIEVVSRLRAS